MKNKPVFFSFILCVVGIFVLLNYPQKAHAIIYLSENWDTGTPPTDWPCKNLPNSCTANTFSGWTPRNYDCNQSGGALSGLSTSIYHSAPRSYYQNRPANDYWTCDISKGIPEPYPTKIHMRFYVYFTNNWVNFNRNAADEFVHFIFTNTAVSGSGWRMNIIDYVSAEWPYECSRDTDAVPNMYFAIQDGSTQGRRGTAPYDCFDLNRHLNEWLCVEFMADATNDRYSLWINGDQKVNNVSTPISQANFTAVILSGWNSILRDYTGDFYIDDIVVADSYIGCGGGGDTQAPTIPANLSAQAISSSQINLAWTASTDNVAVTGYRIYRDGALLDTSSTNSYSNTGLSASTAYTYSVSAYDAAGNASSQSSSASATTSSGSDSVGGGSGGSNQNTGSGEGTQQTTSQGSTEISGGGCGYIDVSGSKGNGSGGNVSQALSFIMMLMLILTGLSLARRASQLKNSSSSRNTI